MSKTREDWVQIYLDSLDIVKIPSEPKPEKPKDNDK